MSTRTTGKSGGARTQSRSGSGARQAGPKPKRSGSADKGTAARQRATPRDGAAARHAAPSKKAATQSRNPNLTEDGKWRLRLYVAGQTPKSLTAFTNLKRLCEQYLPGQYHIEVIDLVENPQLAQGDQIVAVPTLVRRLPQPLKRVIGDLSNTERALIGLELRPGS